MLGGHGDDSYVVDVAGDTITEGFNEGVDTVRSSVTFALAANVDHLILTGNAEINGSGNTLDNFITGNSARNTLWGSDGDDVLDGAANADLMIGGRGDDFFIVESSGDLAVDHLNEGIDTVLSAVTYTLGNNLENLVLTGSAAIDGTGNQLDNILIGNSARNRLTGREGNDTLDGREGADTLVGAGGNDVYFVDHSGDVVTELAGGGIDTVRSTISYTLAADLENLVLSGFLDINGTGNASSNVITGSGGRNRLTGGDGNDTLDDGGFGLDTLIGGRGDDTYLVHGSGVVVSESAGEGRDLVVSTANFTLSANVEDLTLTGALAIYGTGNAAANVLTGSAVANLLDGAAGADLMMGGLGNDTYVVDHLLDDVRENASEGLDTVRSFISYTLGNDVERLTLMGSAAIDGTGNALDNELRGNGAANTLRGGFGNDVLDGAAGADMLRGEQGNDSYYVDNTADRVVEVAGGGSDVVFSMVTYTLSANVEDLTLQGSAAIDGTGNAENNVLRGNSAANVLSGAGGNDFIDGGPGMDTMRGGAGDDTYVVNEADYSNAPTVLLLEGEPGNGIVSGAVAFTPADGEFRVSAFDFNVDGIADTIQVVYINNPPSGAAYGLAFSTYALGTNLVPGTYDDIERHPFESPGHPGFALAGDGPYPFLIDGSFTVNEAVFDYSAGVPQVVSFSAEFDQHAPGEPDPRAVFGRINYNYGAGSIIPETVIELANEGTDTVRSAVDYTLGANVENLVLTGNRALRGTGNALANVITGNALDNFLDGGAGADSLKGGWGDDNYTVDHAGDTVTENASEGTDTVNSSVTHALGANLEILILTGSAAIDGTGNALANVLTGNSAANVLTGGGGNDRYVLVGAGDSVVELAGEGVDGVESTVSYTLGANVENLTLLGTASVGTGNALANVITGNAAANTLDGRGGIDILGGFAGDDIYVVDAADVIFENPNEGVDLVRASVSYVLAANVENLTLTGGGHISATGNELANEVRGNSGNNILDGAGGLDTMIGGAGNDTYIVDQGDESNAATVLRLHGEPGAWVFAGDADFALSDGTFTVSAQDVTGDGLADTLNLFYLDHVGFTGNWYSLDVTTRATGQNLEPGVYPDAQRAAFAAPGHPGLDLSGNGMGSNELAGSFTINEAVFDYSGGTISVVRFSVDFEQRSENFFPPVSGRFNYNYSLGVTVPESVIELANQGSDTVKASIDYVLPDHVEHLTLTGSNAIGGGGNALNNLITGNSAANRLTGGGGRDIFDFTPGSVAADSITDFTVGVGGDVLGLSEVLPGFVGGTSAVADFVRLLDDGAGGTAVQVNGDGVGSDFSTIVYLENVAMQANLLTNMLGQGNIFLG
jgi:Ca2+-binding RTX toxin-like protein